MIKNLLFVCSILAIAVHIQAQSPGQTCRTPNNESGICVRIRNCPSLQGMLSQAVVFPSTREFVRQSRCGGDIVCCTDSATTPPPRTTTTTTRRPIATTPTTRGLVTTTKTVSNKIFSERISAKKCDEYAEYAYNKTYTIQIFGPDKVGKISNCAATSIGLVYGGIEAKRREFPHMALIGYFYRNEIHWECGGTLISERFVLSAEHCSWTERNGPAKYVRLGEHNIAETVEANHIDFDIIETFLHVDAPPKTFNDIALFKLNRDVKFDHAIRPACLPQQLDVQREVTATGWGTVPGGTRSNTLLKVDITTFSQDEWSKTYIGQLYNKDYEFDEKSMVFAGHHTESRDTCDGDSGGPLQFLDPNRNCTYIVVGVTSRGISCGHTGKPAIYTGVYSHLDWIERTVWPTI